MLKVKDVLKFLETLDPEMQVGKVGHFGEFIEANECTFRTVFVDGKAAYGWGQVTPFKAEVLDLESIDIGPEPD